jgi:hypothetical protein
MDQTDFALLMVSGVLVIIAFFLFILFKIFGKKKKNRPIVTLLPETTKNKSHESQPEKFVIRPQEIEGLEKEFHQVRDLPKMEFVKEIILEKKDTIEEPLKGSSWPKKEEPVSQSVFQSIEENEKLKLEDILIEIRDENTPKKAKKKIISSKNLEKTDKFKERETPEKKPMKRPIEKKSEKDRVPEQVLKVPDEKSSGKKSVKKVSAKKIKQSIVNKNPGSGEL